MLRDRYEPVDLFALVPQLGLEFEPQLAQLDQLLDDDQIFARVRDDLGRRYPLTRVHGRRSTPVEVILRMLVVMRLYGWSFEKTEYFVNDSLVLRQFCRVYLEKVPDDTTLIRWARLVGPETLQCSTTAPSSWPGRKVTRGRKLRVDTTAVETEIHYPTDSGLIGDGVRVVSRLLRRAKAVLGEAATKLEGAFRSRVRTVRKLAPAAAPDRPPQGRAGPRGAQGGLHQADRDRRADRGPGQAGAGGPEASGPEGGRAPGRAVRRVPAPADPGDRAGRRRVLEGESVPAEDKLLSLFEPHTQIIPRFKAGKPVEFGRKLRLDEVEGGIISGYAILEQGGGQDQPYLKDSLATHRRHFGRAPDLLAADRGMSSAENEELAVQAGVKQVALPQVGKASAERKELEKGRRFRRGLSVPGGDRGPDPLAAARLRPEEMPISRASGMGRWVGWGIVTHNLSRSRKRGRPGEMGKGRSGSDRPCRTRVASRKHQCDHRPHFAPQTSSTVTVYSMRPRVIHGRFRIPGRIRRGVAARRTRLPSPSAGSRRLWGLRVPWSAGSGP